jgi:hypothetical protein
VTFPGNLPAATVTGTLRDMSGVPLTGAVMTFTPSVKRVDDPSSGDQFYETTDTPTCTTGATTGAYTVDLIPNNDPDETPVNWLWHVHVAGEDNASPPQPFTDDYDILIPFDEPDVILPAVIQRGNAPGTVNPVSLGMLVDIDLSTPPTNAQALIYDATAKKWKPGSAGGGGTGLPSGGTVGQIVVNTAPGDGDWDDAPTIASLGGITAPSSPADNQVVAWDADSSAWVAAALSSLGTITQTAADARYLQDTDGSKAEIVNASEPTIYRNETAGTYALRNTVTASSTRVARWSGKVEPTAGSGYALEGDIWRKIPT